MCRGVWGWLTLLNLQLIDHRCYIHWLIVTNLGQDDHYMYRHMSHDFDLGLTFDLDIWVNAKFGGYMFYASQKSELYLLSMSLHNSQKCICLCNFLLSTTSLYKISIGWYRRVVWQNCVVIVDEIHVVKVKYVWPDVKWATRFMVLKVTKSDKNGLTYTGEVNYVCANQSCYHSDIKYIISFTNW